MQQINGSFFLDKHIVEFLYVQYSIVQKLIFMQHLLLIMDDFSMH